MMNTYNMLSKGHKRLIVAGYFVYLFWMIALDGWDDVLEDVFEHISDNRFFLIAASVLFYWVIVILFLWIKEGFDD